LASKGQLAASGQRGDSGDDQNDAGSEAYDGGIGYGRDCTVMFAQGRLWLLVEELPPIVDDDLEW
jgi:hypothetical protein